MGTPDWCPTTDKTLFNRLRGFLAHLGAPWFAEGAGRGQGGRCSLSGVRALWASMRGVVPKVEQCYFSNSTAWRLY